MSTAELSHKEAAQPEGAEAHLFSPIQIRGVALPNRIVVSPMCQYSSEDGFANDWHLVHLGSRAVGGAGLIFTEAAAVEARGRISPYDLGIWKEEHAEPLARIVRFLKQHGSVPGIQLAHAGRKASTEAPWRGRRAVKPSDGGWEPVGPSAVAFDNASLQPAELSVEQIHEITSAFVAASKRAIECGFEVIELHGAHGYLLHEFLSPLSNKRKDQYGGSFENRIRFALEMVEAVRSSIADRVPLFLRISATDWVDGGWSLEESVELARAVKPLGVDLIDCSSGGSSPDAVIPLRAGYQVPFSERIRKEAGILTGAVGLITDPQQADDILCNGAADLIFLAREFLREPYWPIKAAHALGTATPLPVQYARAFPNQPAK
jgi:2,4-dienoyl-CoA reductase-like NADH-dependent reductase (Old Yellow Enzyme family)